MYKKSVLSILIHILNSKSQMCNFCVYVSFILYIYYIQFSVLLFLFFIHLFLNLRGYDTSTKFCCNWTLFRYYEITVIEYSFDIMKFLKEEYDETCLLA